MIHIPVVVVYRRAVCIIQYRGGGWCKSFEIISRPTALKGDWLQLVKAGNYNVLQTYRASNSTRTSTPRGRGVGLD